MATGNIKIDEGTTTQLATNPITEDAATKHLSRAVINTSAGVESGTSGSPFRVDPTGTTVQPIGGAIAHDAADSGNPLKIGGKARQTNPTAVADGDRVDATFDDIGRSVVVLNQVRDLAAEAVLTLTASTSETTLITAIASTLIDITSLIITNSSATATLVTLRDATGGGTARVYSIAANGGLVINFPVPLKQATANNNWTVQCGTSVSSIYVHAVYVKNV